MSDWITRAQIGLKPRNGGGVSLNPSVVIGYAWHWPGMAKPIDARGAAGMRRVCSALRGWQDYHMRVRKWSDIAYSWAVDQMGRKYTLRGLNVKSGANGDNRVNTLYGAGLLILAPGEKPSAAMIATIKEVGAEFCARFPKSRKKPYGHKDVRPAGTDCPGPLAYAAIKAGTFTPGTAASKPPAVTPPKKDDEDVSAYSPDQIKAYAGQGVHGQKLGRSTVTIGMAIDSTRKLTAATNAAVAKMSVQLAALTATVNALATQKSVDVNQIKAAIDDAVNKAMEDLQVTLSVEDDDDEVSPTPPA